MIIICSYFKASNPQTTTIGIRGNTISTGSLSANNRAALQTSMNQYVSSQSGFSQCSTQINDATAGSCSSQGRRRRRQQQSGWIHMRKEDFSYAFISGFLEH